MDKVKIYYNDKFYEYPKGIKLLDVAKDFQKDFKYPILVAIVNEYSTTLDFKITEDSKVKFYDISSSKGYRAYERTAILILVKAIRDVLNKEVKIEHSIDRGIYCNVDGLKEEDVEKISNKMIEIVNRSIPIEKLSVNRLKIIEYFRKLHDDNACVFKYMSKNNVTIYKLDDMYDYIFGKICVNTSYLDNFKLEYIGNNGFVLMLPFIYDNMRVNDYTHHEKFFNSVLDYINWTDKIGIKSIVDLNLKLSEGKWNDMVFMSEASYNKSLLDIVEKINDKIKIILIGGPSSSGKTTTANKLKLFLSGRGYKPTMLSTDDYFKERDETPLDENGNKDYESINAIDVDLFNKQLKDLVDGKEVDIPTFNFLTGKKEYKKKLKLDKDGILVIEGLHTLNDVLTSSIERDKKYKIYISPLTGLNVDDHNRLNSTDSRLLRRMVRDNLRRGYNASHTLSTWDSVRAGETKYVFPYQDEADIVLNTSLIYELSVLKVYAEPLLFSVDERDPNYSEAVRLIGILKLILPMPSEGIPLDSLLREFIGGSCFE